MNKISERLRRLAKGFLLGDGTWATMRLVATLFSWFLWGALFRTVFGSLLGGIRYLILPVGVIVSVIALGARYVQDIYNLKNYWAAFRYILASFFGIGYPNFRIDHGKKEPNSDGLGLMETIGGPGYLTVLPGNAVLLERLEGPKAICGSGSYFLPRFDGIGAIVDLEEQQYDTKIMKATSKDGIPVVVSNIYYHYRISSGANRTRTESDPYPFSVQAVRKFAYSRSVTSEGLTHWETAVKLAIEGAISAYINAHQIDRITAPSHLENDPRHEIATLITSANTRDRLKSIGTDLLWFDIGSINAGANQIDTQRMKAWQAKWNEHSTVTRAQGEARRIEFEEVGRVEMQAESLRSILHSFQSLHSTSTRKDNIRKIVMARTAQILESMSSLYRNPDGDLIDGSTSAHLMHQSSNGSSVADNKHKDEKETEL